VCIDGASIVRNGLRTVANLAQKGAFNEIKSTPKPIEDMDRMLPMLLQKEVLDATGNSPDNNEKKEDTEEGPTVTDNPESDSPIMNAGE